MKKYDMKKIMNNAWKHMRLNKLGGVYRISFSEALSFAWKMAKRDYVKFEISKKIVASGKYDYLINEKNLGKRYDLVRKAFSALRDEGEEVRKAFYKKGLMSKNEFNDYIAIKNPAEHELLSAFQATCKKVSCHQAWNVDLAEKLGPLPEEEF